ncbi:MAG: hypothetical protein MZU79_02945 [Anaerotruncus sp.]|nr:hypothetical protein [Anaerotruncus sp.]
MIEVPRGALTADEIAEEAEFFSLRHQRPHADDLRLLARRHRQVPAALPGARRSLEHDPFARHRHASASASSSRWPSRRAARRGPDLKLGICGEHGGDPNSVEFCYQVGMDYVSCSPYRVPIARLAAAQAAIAEERSLQRSQPHRRCSSVLTNEPKGPRLPHRDARPLPASPFIWKTPAIPFQPRLHPQFLLQPVGRQMLRDVERLALPAD